MLKEQCSCISTAVNEYPGILLFFSPHFLTASSILHPHTYHLSRKSPAPCGYCFCAVSCCSLQSRRLSISMTRPKVTPSGVSLDRADNTEFVVNGSGLPFVNFDIGESYAGYLPNTPSGISSLYFWFFPSSDPKASDEVHPLPISCVRRLMNRSLSGSMADQAAALSRASCSKMALFCGNPAHTDRCAILMRGISSPT